jgi:hypothetical protein
MFSFFRDLRRERWKEYASPKEKFSARFPGEVTRHFFGFLEDDGESPGTVVYSSKSRDGVIYDIRVTRIMDYFGPAEEFLETALTEMTRSMTNCVIGSQKSERIQDCPAIVFEARIREIMSLHGVITLHGKTLYIISALFRSGSAHDLPFFLDGFEVVQ